ncbi:MAG: hypothetical protein ACREM1_23390 [Longimicrobiales bacterium]
MSEDTLQHGPRARAVHFAWLYLLAWLPYLIAYGLVLGAALEVPASLAVAAAVANGLPPATLGWAAIGIGKAITWRSGPVAKFLALHAAAAALYALASAAGTWLLFRVLNRLESGTWDWALGDVGPLVWQLLIATLLYAVLAGIGNALALQQRLREEESRAARARELATRSQLEALRARLDPHFLFNLRFGDRLVWHEAIQPETLACRVPALSLQPLVENALRYAVAPRAEGGRIDLRTRMREGRLEIDVADDGPATTANSIAVPRASLFHCDSGSSRPALIRSVSFVFTAPT